jgi:hypothetical protein
MVIRMDSFCIKRDIPTGKWKILHIRYELGTFTYFIKFQDYPEAKRELQTLRAQYINYFPIFWDRYGCQVFD